MRPSLYLAWGVLRVMMSRSRPAYECVSGDSENIDEHVAFVGDPIKCV